MPASDVFLSYSRADAAAVEAVRARLTERGVSSFLDRTRLPAGQPWQPFLEQQIQRAGAVAVFLGQRMGSWQHREVQLALDRQGREPDFPVIPILLPKLDDEPTGFLSLQTWIDLRADPNDPAQLQTLIAAIHGEAPEEASAELKASICPYRGLLPFREEDAGFFFGRGEESQALLAKVRRHPVVGVIGRSGSGKSSLVFAGLFPKLRQSPDGTVWDMMVIRPGEDPLAALVRAISPPPENVSAIQQDTSIENDVRALREGSAHLPRLIRHHLEQRSGTGTDRLLLYVDQWEELYTQASRAGDADKRAQKQADVARFIDLLLEATEDSPLSLVFTVRADFYDRLLQHHRLKDIAQSHQISLGPLKGSQLRECIEQPATTVGLGFEDGLVDRIIEDVGGDEGKLPLLEYALKGTWQNSRQAWARGTNPLLTHAAYETAGRVEGAIAGKADEVYQKLTDAQKEAARRLFVNLVTPGEGQADTRAIARVPDDPAVAEVVELFCHRDQRLLVTGHDPTRGRVAEVSHEALIRNWAELRGWVEANRQRLLTRDRIAGAMRRWRDKSKPDDLLLSPGVDLEEGRQLLNDHGDVAIDDIEPYIERSDAADKAHRQQEQRRRDEENERRVEAARTIAAANKRTAQRSAVGLAAAVVLAVVAGWQWFEATDQRTVAEVRATEAEEAKTRADERAEEAKAAKLEADEQRQRAEGETERARVAERSARRQESRALAALAQSETRAGNAVNGMLLALRGMPLESADEPPPVVTENRQALVDAMQARRELLALRGHEAWVLAAGFSPDGGRIVSGSDDGTVRVWEATSDTELRGHEKSVNSAGFSPDGGRIVSGSDDGTVRVWDAASGTELLTLRGLEKGVRAAGFSPDGRRIVSGSIDGTVRVWDAASGTELLALRGHESWVSSAGFSPDGHRIFSGSADGTVRVWDAASGTELLTLRDPEVSESVFAAGFSPDGRRIVSGYNYATVRVWDAASGAELLALRGAPSGREEPVFAAGFSPDGRWIVSGHLGGVFAAGFSHDGRRIVSGHLGGVFAAGFSHDGRRIVSGSEDGTIRVWDAASGAELLALRGHEGFVLAAGFSPDGRRIVSGSGDATVRVWFVGADDAALVRHACASLPRDLSSEDIARFNLDPDAPWPCAERAKTLWPHPVAEITPAAGPDQGTAAAQ